MLGHERMAQKIPKEYDFSGHETYDSNLMMGKHLNLRRKNTLTYGARAPSLQYKHTNQHRARIPVFERIRLEFQ